MIKRFFKFATGIENNSPAIANGRARIDRTDEDGNA